VLGKFIHSSVIIGEYHLHRGSGLYRGVHSPSQWWILHILPYFHKIYKFTLLPQNVYIFSHISAKFTFFGLIYVFHFPLFWPWCICAPCFTRIIIITVFLYSATSRLPTQKRSQASLSQT